VLCQQVKPQYLTPSIGVKYCAAITSKKYKGIKTTIGGTMYFAGTAFVDTPDL
jgi:hypothetical protein